MNDLSHNIHDRSANPKTLSIGVGREYYHACWIKYHVVSYIVTCRIFFHGYINLYPDVLVTVRKISHIIPILLLIPLVSFKIWVPDLRGLLQHSYPLISFVRAGTQFKEFLQITLGGQSRCWQGGNYRLDNSHGTSSQFK